jgi:pyrroline-5-carboxylate reductase
MAQAAATQGLPEEGIIDAICDVFIGSALLLKSSKESPETLINRVCSKGGTTEQAINKLNEANVDNIILEAMLACTQRADELGKDE